MFLNISLRNVETFVPNFALSVFVLYDLISNKARKLEVAEPNIIMENIPSSLSSVGWSLFPSLFRSRFISHSLSLSLSLSLLNSFVDAALWRMLCGVMSSSITLISRPFNQAKASLTEQWLGTDESNRAPVV